MRLREGNGSGHIYGGQSSTVEQPHVGWGGDTGEETWDGHTMGLQQCWTSIKRWLGVRESEWVWCGGVVSVQRHKSRLTGG